jgi:Uma2 family endonuclease
MHRAEPQVLYALPEVRPGWELSEETMPESVVHDDAVDLLRALLKWWARGRNVQVARNLAIRWDEANPKIGVDPDVCVLSPPPPLDGKKNLRSVRTWKPGHSAPLLAIEVVSDADPAKDYTIAPDKYAASGTGELWVFDPLLAGPTTQGGPFRLQVWERDKEGRLARTYAGDGPATTSALGAHLVVLGDGRELRISDDAAGSKLWLTRAEAAEAAPRVAEAERAAKEKALARVAALEEALKKRG